MIALVLGSNGQLGCALADTLPADIDFVGFDLPELDITNANSVLDVCRKVQPGVIVNAAAYTAVDQAESNPRQATAINVDGPRNVADSASAIGARLIHISTDFVFDGASSSPYSPDTPPNPLSVYGRTKRDGELAVLGAIPDASVIVRSAWLYSRTGGNFVKTMLRLMGQRDELSVVSDQIGTPTWAESLAEAVWAFVGVPSLSGIYHWTDQGEASWNEFAIAIQDAALELGLLSEAIPIHAITTADYPTPAQRPCYSVLDISATCAALGIQPTHWRVNLRKMLKGMAA